MKDKTFKKNAKVLRDTIFKLQQQEQTEQVKQLIFLHNEALTVVENMDSKNPMNMAYAKLRLKDITASITYLVTPLISKA